ncbi:MAG: hypothetical protein ACRC7R_00710 [Sarcina sp.]
MYYLFKYKNITPSVFFAMKTGEKNILHAFVTQEIEDSKRENRGF